MTQFSSHEQEDSENSDITTLHRLDPANSSTELAGLDAYLESICRIAATRLTDETLLEQRQEMDAQLRTTFAAYLELGYDAKNALAHTITQLGSAESVAKKWSSPGATSIKMQASQTGLERASVRSRLSLLVPVTVWSLTYFSLIGLGAVVRMNPTMADAQREAVALIGAFGIPIAAGATVGWFSKRRPILSNAAGLISVLPIYLLLIYRQLNAISPDGGQSVLWYAVNPVTIWLLLSSASAAVAGKFRRSIKLPTRSSA